MPFLGNTPAQGFANSVTKDDFTPNGSTTAFTLSKVATTNSIEVYVGNVRQEPTDAYSVSGTTLAMTEAPATGTNFYVMHVQGTIESTTVPPAGSIVANSLASTLDLSGKTVTYGLTDSDMPAGSVLQVVSAAHGTRVANSSGSYVDTGLQATITPTSTTSKILVMVDQQGCKAVSMQTGDINIKLQKNSTDVHKFALGYWYGGGSSEFRGGISTHFVDSPSSTSALAYKTVFRANDGGSCTVQNDNANTVSTITLMEIQG